MAITVRPLSLKGLFEVRPRVFGDARGYFFESYSRRDFQVEGLDQTFVQDNQSYSRKGILRGLHFQKTHPQGKLVRVVSGEVYDVAVDLRSGSPTFGRYCGLILSAKEQNQFYIPPGFAHGFLVLSDDSVFAYKCTDYYHPEDEGGIRWDDPTLDIDWPVRDVLVSDKDAALPAFDPSARYFGDLS